MADGVNTSKVTMTKGLLTVQEALALAPVGKTMFYELMGNGTIETAHVGRKRLVRRESLDRYISALEGRPVASILQGAHIAGGARLIIKLEEMLIDGNGNLRGRVFLAGGAILSSVTKVVDIADGLARFETAPYSASDMRSQAMAAAEAVQGFEVY